MFKCQFCGTQVPRGVRPVTVVTGKRDRVYSQKWVRVPNTKRARDKWNFRKLPKAKQGGTKNHKPRLLEVLVPDHIGWEITQERRACRSCATAKREAA